VACLWRNFEPTTDKEGNLVARREKKKDFDKNKKKAATKMETPSKIITKPLPMVKTPLRIVSSCPSSTGLKENIAKAIDTK
jgi:hypothetical protein